MTAKPIHDPADGPLRCIALMSGSGTNVRRILEHGERLREKEGKSPFEVVVIFSDSHQSRATEIGRDFDIPVVTRDLVGWMRKHNVKREELDKRERFDRENLEILKPFGARVAIYGGYMAIASPSLINAYLGVNVHPADLSITLSDGGRRWRGAHAVRDAIAGGETSIRSTTHLVTYEVDMGPLLMISEPLAVHLTAGANLSDPEALQEISGHHQDRLKEAGDWVVFPKTIEYLARGWFGRDDQGMIYFKGEPIPEGLRL